LPSNLDKKIISNIKKTNIKKIKSFNYSITTNLFNINVYKVSQSLSVQEASWVNISSINKLPLPTLFKKVLFD